ncbi:protein TRC8 homolog isoform X2 [Anabrus simplex]
MALLMASSFFYVLLVVPIAAGYFSLGSAIRSLRMAMMTSLDGLTLCSVMRHSWLLMVWFHEIYCGLRRTHTTVTQILFFLIAEKALCPDQRFISLYGLLFCTMLAYLYHSLQARHWTQLMFTTTTADFLRLTSAFIIIRLGKGVAMSFILISITLQFDHLEPSMSFIIVTVLYFVLTQFLKTAGKENIVVYFIQQLELNLFDGLEEYWIPLILNSITVLLTLGNVVIAFYNNIENLPLCLIVSYSNVVVVAQQMFDEYLLPLRDQQLLMERYPFANKEQLAQFGDGVCAVCLDDMHLFTARITPCRHIFHGKCLRRCLQQYQQCPLCKQQLVYNI